MRISITLGKHVHFFLDVSSSSSPGVLGRQSLCEPSYHPIFGACFFFNYLSKGSASLLLFQKSSRKNQAQLAIKLSGGGVPEVGG